MSITVHVFMTCDRCGQSTEDYGVGCGIDGSKSAILKATKQNGWIRRRGEDICNDCVKDEKGAAK